MCCLVRNMPAVDFCVGSFLVSIPDISQKIKWVTYARGGQHTLALDVKNKLL
jgi:hypothetical protein